VVLISLFTCHFGFSRIWQASLQLAHPHANVCDRIICLLETHPNPSALMGSSQSSSSDVASGQSTTSMAAQADELAQGLSVACDHNDFTIARMLVSPLKVRPR
jgi:hypothetical protein